jgi:hypothetical protein
MSLLSLYSKIQLKIEKAEKELNLKIPNSQRIRSLDKFQLLFYKTARIIVRFFALLFNDSSENYLIFTRFNKDSVVVCNNSFCQYKRFQKKVRFYSKMAFAGILICTIITSSVLYFMMPGKPSSFAATYTWDQTDWSEGADTVNFPVHPTNQAGWEKYYEKDSYVDDSTAGEIKLSQTSDSWTETSDVDFNAGDPESPPKVQTSGTGDAADLTLLPGNTATADSFIDTSKIASSSNINFDMANGQAKLTSNNSAFDCAGGTDYAGADWTPANGSTVSGIHCNIATFSIPTSYIIYTTAEDIFKVSANTISVVGTLNADAKGYAGGNGGAEGVKPEGSGLAGSSGVNSGSYGGIGGTGGTGGSGGEYHGSGGVGGTSVGTTRGDISSCSIEMGGGAGGGGGSGATTNYNGAGGSAGEKGGGAMLLYGNAITISGIVTANGGTGGNGGDKTTSQIYTGGGGGGSGGSGGGVLMNGIDAVITGVITANGGTGGSGGEGGSYDGLPGNQGGGGRIKIFYKTIDTSSATIAANGYNNGTVYTQLSSYFSPGTFASTNLLSGQAVGPIDSFSYNFSSLPSGTTANISFSQDNTNWFNSAGTADGWNAMGAGSNTVDLSELNWTGANFYYKMEWTSDGSDTPVLDEVSVHTNYPSSGTYISSAHDTGMNDPTYLNLSYSANLPISPTYFGYQKAITLNNSGSALTDYQILVTLDTAALISAGKMRNDCGDIRFYDTGENLLDYWIESGCNTDNTRIWVKVPTISAGGETIIYLYYGNSSTESTSDSTVCPGGIHGGYCCDFFDDFSGTSQWPTGTGTNGTTNYGYVSASQTGNGTFSSTLVSNVIGSGTFKATLNIQSSGTAGTGCSYAHNLYQRTTTDTLLDDTAYGSYTTRTYDLSGTDVKLKLYALATGNNVGATCSISGNDCEECYYLCEHGDACDCAAVCPGPSASVCAYCCSGFSCTYHGGTDYTASSSVYMNDVYVRKYTASEPSVSIGTESAGTYLTDGTGIKFQIKTADSEGGLGSADWYGPTGATDYYVTSGTAINSTHTNDRWIQYKAILETTDATQTPLLHDATMSFGLSSTLTSSSYDASDSGQVINQIVWTETVPADTNVKFQMRTAPESSGTYTIWMGPDGTADTYFDEGSSGCSKTGSDVTCDVLNTLGISDGVNDRWMQYKVWLTSSTAETPTLSNVSIQYVVNATPVVSNVTASQGTDGVISISYDLSDADSSSFTVSALADIGITLNEELTSSDVTAITVSDASLLPASGTIQIDNEQISYTSKSGNDLAGTITRGANNSKTLSHSSATAVWVKGSTVSGDVGASQTAGTGKSVSWTIKTDLDGVYHATAKIRVSANDGNAANQVGNGDSVAFALDTKDPVLGANPILIDASLGLDSTALTLDATDDTALEMKLSNNTDLSADGVNADSGSWITYASSKSWIFSTDPDTVYVQFKDSKGNTTTTQSLESLLTPEYFMIQDISNLDSSEFREFVAWKVLPIRRLTTTPIRL